MSSQRRDFGRRWRFVDKEREQLGTDKVRRRRVPDKNIDNIVTVEVTCLSEESLDPIVMLLRVEREQRRIPVKLPASKGAGGFFDIVFGIPAADTQREQLHQLPAIVFVRPVFAVVCAIEPDQHGRVPRDGLKHCPKIAEGMGPEGLVLPPHPAGVVDFVICRCEVPMPEQSQLLFERSGRMGHPVQPPLFDAVERVKIDVIALNVLEDRAKGIRHRFGVEKLLRGSGEAKLRIGRPFVGPCAKPSPPEQMSEVAFLSGRVNHRPSLQTPGGCRELSCRTDVLLYQRVQKDCRIIFGAYSIQLTE